MPEIVQNVPALLLLNENYRVLYGENIYSHLKPKQEVITKVATQNNMEPMAFGLGGSLGGIVSDHFSFLDMDADSLNAKGNGGLRQLHNYVSLNDSYSIHTPNEDAGEPKMGENITIEQLQKQRESELSSISQPRR
jgi:hypothetical protein